MVSFEELPLVFLVLCGHGDGVLYGDMVFDEFPHVTDDILQVMVHSVDGVFPLGERRVAMAGQDGFVRCVFYLVEDVEPA